MSCIERLPGPDLRSMDLLLRPWTEDDAPAFREAMDEDVRHLKPWLSWTREEPATLERTRERLGEWVRAFREGRSCVVLDLCRDAAR